MIFYFNYYFGSEVTNFGIFIGEQLENMRNCFYSYILERAHSIRRIGILLFKESKESRNSWHAYFSKS